MQYAQKLFAKFKASWTTGLLCTVGTLGAIIAPMLGNDWLEGSLGLPALYHLRGVRPAPNQIVIVALDTVSANALNLPPAPDKWPRDLYAKLIHTLARNGVIAIGVDLLFGQERNPQHDQELAQAIHSAGNVVLVEGIRRQWVRDANGNIVAALDTQLQSISTLRQNAHASAPFMLPKTAAGVAEFWLHPALSGGKPSFPFVLAQTMKVPLPSPTGLRSSLPTNERARLNLFGPAGTVRTIPYHRAMQILADPTAAKANFDRHVVLIGLSEFNQSAQRDAYRTPFSSEDGLDISGVELAATALANLLNDSTLLRLPPWADLLINFLMAIGLITVWLKARSGLALTWTVGVSLAYAAVACTLFSQYAIWVPIIVPTLCLPILISVAGFYRGHRLHLQNYARLSDTFARYLPRQAIDRLADALAKSGGSTLFATCMCSDIEAYSSLSEELGPEELRDRLNRYFALFMPVVEKHGGQIVDIVGDAVMSIWVSATGEQSVCDAALAASHDLNLILNSTPHSDALPTRFGLHYGQIFFGEVGATEHREIRVVGDIVNTASRIQNANKWLGTRILVSSRTQLESAGTIYLGRFRLAGKREAVELYSPDTTNIPAEARSHFEQAISAFEHGNVTQACTGFLHAYELAPNWQTARHHYDYCETALKQPQSFADAYYGVFISQIK